MNKPSYQMISVDKSGIEVSLLHRHPHGVSLTVYGPPPQNERLDIRLNEYGALADLSAPQDKQLKTMVEVKGSQGNVYRVDLTDLFFQQTSLIEPIDAGPYLCNDDQLRERGEVYSGRSVFSDKSRLGQLKEVFGPDHEQAERHVGISIRKKCSADELRINFPEPYEEVEDGQPCTSKVPTFIHGLENVRELQFRIQQEEYDVGMGRMVPAEH